MSKPIFVKEADLTDIMAEIKAQLSGLRCYGSVAVRKNFKSDDRRANLYFTAEAWLKMTALVEYFSTEVQWHGLTRRLDDNTFEIYDILVFPHKVTGTTVISDQEEYSKWLDGLDDDSFNALKMHGHSHVNMDPEPSCVDEEYRKKLVTQLPNPTASRDVFYIFMIINKSHKWTAEIYDFTNNALYSTTNKDIDLSVWFDDYVCLSSFIQDAKTKATYSYTSTTTKHETKAAPVVSTQQNNDKKEEKKTAEVAKNTNENKTNTPESDTYDCDTEGFKYDSRHDVYYIDGVFYCGECGKQHMSHADAVKCNHIYDDDDFASSCYANGGLW